MSKILHLSAEDVVLAVQLPEDRAVVLYGVSHVEVPLDAPFGVGDIYQSAEVVAAKKSKKPVVIVETPVAE